MFKAAAETAIREAVLGCSYRRDHPGSRTATKRHLSDNPGRETNVMVIRKTVITFMESLMRWPYYGAVYGKEKYKCPCNYLWYVKTVANTHLCGQ